MKQLTERKLQWGAIGLILVVALIGWFLPKSSKSPLDKTRLIKGDILMYYKDQINPMDRSEPCYFLSTEDQWLNNVGEVSAIGKLFIMRDFKSIGEGQSITEDSSSLYDGSHALKDIGTMKLIPSPMER